MAAAVEDPSQMAAELEDLEAKMQAIGVDGEEAQEPRASTAATPVAPEESTVVVKEEETIPDLPESIPPDGYPESYYSNSHKEKLVLGFVRNFERQFKQLYGQRKPLFTIVPNEFGVEKFVCTTVRPTLLPYKELYSFDGAARFVSEYLVYVPLRKPLEPPARLVAPTTTMWNQHGNSFDMSVLLCSLLEGAGYDAYCAHGYASKEVCEMDRARAVLGAAAPEAAPQRVAAEAKANKYAFKSGKQLESKFEAERAKRESEQKKAANPAAEEKAAPAPAADPLLGLRVHCWVLVLAGKRDVPEAFFIEPSTGTAVSATDASYVGIEAVWNSKNYWVNMQSCAGGLKNMCYDLADTVQWEYIFPNPAFPKISANVAGAEEEAPSADLLVLDLPPSWVEPIELTPKAYETRCPKGTKTIVYKDGRTELFSEYLREDGLVRRITRFGASPQQAARVEETFLHRADKLLSRLLLPPERKTVCKYGPGNKFFLQSYTVTETAEGPKHELQFYHVARLDGLHSRTFDFRQLVETYVGRPDRLLSRRIAFDKGQTAGMQRRISALASLNVFGVITETFARNAAVAADEDPARIVFDDDVISVTYHVDDERITAHTRDFEKPGLDDKGMPKPITVEHVASFKVDPKSGPDRNFMLHQSFTQLLRRETESKEAIMAAETEMERIVQARRAEEIEVGLDVSFYDTARNLEAKKRREELERTTKQENARREALEKDYLAPFLVQLSDPLQLSAADAAWVRDACLRDLKDRLVEQAARTQEWVEKEQAELQQRRQWFEKNKTTVRLEEEDKYKSFCEETAFRIKILQQRLIRMKDTAPLKYTQMEERLRRDPRLAKHMA